MLRISAVTDREQLRAGLELLDAAAPGAPARSGRDLQHYWTLIRSSANSVWCAEDREGVRGVFLGTPCPGRLTYYDVCVAPGQDAEGLVADLVRAGADAAYAGGQSRLTSHDPIDGAELYEALGHTPTMRVQLNGTDRRERRTELVRAMAAYRLLHLDEAPEWAAAHFRIDRVDVALKRQLTGRQQLAMHMLHRWTEPTQRTRYVVSGFPRFSRATAGELRTIDPELTTERHLHDGTYELRAGRPGHDLVPAIQANPVTFAHSVVPADLDIELTGDQGDLERIAEAARRLPLEVGGTFAVECRKGRTTIGGNHPATAYTCRDVEIRVGTALFQPGRHPVDLDQPERIVSVYLEGNRALLGLADPPFADQARRAAARPTRISRAEHKLAEALEMWRIPLPDNGSALDLGAAPGGWTYLLAQRGLTVYAVDPGELNPIVAAHPRVVQLRTRAESVDLRANPVDLVVNDMNLDPHVSAQVMCTVAGQVRAGAYGILTIKLPSTHPDPGIARAHAELAGAYDVLATRHLPHNRQEVTTLLRRKPLPT